MFLGTLDYAPSVEEIDGRYGADLNVFGPTPWNMRTLPRGRVKGGKRAKEMEDVKNMYIN